MTPLEQALATLVGRDPTAEEMAKFYKIKEACGFSEHDSVWAMLLAFGHYEILYGEIPKQIADKTHQVLADHKLALEATASAAEKHIKANLVDAVAKTARDMADQVIKAATTMSLKESRRKFLLALSLSLGLAASVVALVGWGAYSLGAKSATADAAWLQTREGEAARKLAKINNISAMLECPSSFQQRQEGDGLYCIPFDEKAKRNWGWRIK